MLIFRNEKELEEWYQVVNELSAKNAEEFSLNNLWLTTSNGEVLNCGLLKMAGGSTLHFVEKELATNHDHIFTLFLNSIVQILRWELIWRCLQVNL